MNRPPLMSTWKALVTVIATTLNVIKIDMSQKPNPDTIANILIS
jgi:hypothetical protein